MLKPPKVSRVQENGRLQEVLKIACGQGYFQHDSLLGGDVLSLFWVSCDAGAFLAEKTISMALMESARSMATMLGLWLQLMLRLTLLSKKQLWLWPHLCGKPVLCFMTLSKVWSENGRVCCMKAETGTAHSMNVC